MFIKEATIFMSLFLSFFKLGLEQNKCVICHVDTDESFIKLTKKGFTTLHQYSQKRKAEDISDYLERNFDNCSDIKVWLDSVFGFLSLFLNDS